MDNDQWRPLERCAKVYNEEGRPKRRLTAEFHVVIEKYYSDGAVAQPGERMTGSHEVRGSIPLSSTSKKMRRLEGLWGPFSFSGSWLFIRPFVQ